MIRIPRAHAAIIIEHAWQEAPRECCGLLAGRRGQVERVYRITNIQAGTTRYEMDPEEQYRAIRELEADDLVLLGVYHSHPVSPARPSPTDVELAFYPELVYLICSLQGGMPDLRAFRIVEERVEEVALEIVERSP